MKKKKKRFCSSILIQVVVQLFFLQIFQINHQSLINILQRSPMHCDSTPKINKKDKKINSIVHTLPKAIQIFEVLQHQKKSIYPFQMITKTHKLMKREQEPYNKQMSQGLNNPTKFSPALETVNAHFYRPYLVYDKFNNNYDQQLFNQNIFSIEKLKNLKNIDYITNIQYTQCYQSPNESYLQFNSRFESGNLSMVSIVQDVYYLLLHNDVNTSGYTSWFYFSVLCKKKGKYRFAILNYGKAGVMHNQGVKICIYDKSGWKRGGQNIGCEFNRNLFRRGNYLNFNTLYFQYQFQEDNSEVYFAYNVPYTYNDLCCYLNQIQEKNLSFFNRKLAGISLAGNRLEMVTITNFTLLNDGFDLPIIIIMARSHPGQTVSSWIMHQLINFLISNEPQAKTLRNSFVFKLFPMINPDGVIHGNYRCSLSGRDLNRRWSEMNKQLFPEIYFIKNQIMDISRRRSIKAIIDLHGHTKKKKVFAYGCNNRNQPHRCRLFPYILSKLTTYFQFRFCNYYLNKCKFGTARISLYNQLRIPYIYTIETSQFGTVEGHLSLKVFNQVAVNLGKSFLILFRIKVIDRSQNDLPLDYQKYDKIQSELINDTSLIKIGSQRDSGSESQPSVDNIKLERLEQMNRRKQKKVHSKKQEKQKIQIFHQRAQSSQKINKTVIVRPKTTQTMSKRFLQDEPKQFIKPMHIFQRTINVRNKIKFERTTDKSLERTGKNKQIIVNKGGASVSVKRKTQTLNFINLSLSIFDENTKSQRTTSAITENLREFGQNYFKRNRLGPRNYFHFRRMK